MIEEMNDQEESLQWPEEEEQILHLWAITKEETHDDE